MSFSMVRDGDCADAPVAISGKASSAEQQVRAMDCTSGSSAAVTINVKRHLALVHAFARKDGPPFVVKSLRRKLTRPPCFAARKSKPGRGRPGFLAIAARPRAINAPTTTSSGAGDHDAEAYAGLAITLLAELMKADHLSLPGRLGPYSARSYGRDAN
jgi:hypothetical protein